MKIYFYTLSTPDDLQKKYFVGSVEALQQQYSCEFVTDIQDVPLTTPEDVAIIFIASSLNDFQSLKRLALPENILLVAPNYLYEQDLRLIGHEFLQPYEDKSIHVIYANEVFNQLHYPNSAKIIDTVINNTIQSKYISIQDSIEIQKNIPLDLEAQLNRIIEISSLLKKHDLNPDHFTGAIALKIGNGVLITSSHKDKSNISPERISYIVDYDYHQNAVTWVGTVRPSSESPRAFLAFREIKNAELLMHFHFTPMTYSTQLNTYRTGRYEPYGTYEEARIVVEKLKKTGGFAIASGHGEIFIASNIEQLNDKIESMLSILKIES